MAYSTSSTKLNEWRPETGIDYRPPFLHRWRHAATILPNRLRRSHVKYDRRIRVATSDGDFFHVDCFDRNEDRIAVLLHGLEGSSYSTYMLGMARILADLGWSVHALNHRGCSGITNQTAGAYHSGFTADVTQWIDALPETASVCVVGFSLGGNIALKFNAECITSKVKASVSVSVPLDLAGSGAMLERWFNTVYRMRFLRQLKRKAIEKAGLFPDVKLNVSSIRMARTLREFDDAYTAPVHGFQSASDYYQKCSALYALSSIRRPSLIINAQNDSFLNSRCFPSNREIKNDLIVTCYPKFGGHVGFAVNHNLTGTYWHEQQVVDFIQTFAP